MSSRGGSDRDAGQIRAARLAVARWVEFPVAAVPRPVVLLDGPVKVERGFSTGSAKMAFGLGRVDADEGTPDEVVRSLRAPRFRTQNPPDVQLRVTAARLDQAEFDTDRGVQVLPAWRVEAAETLGPIWVLTDQAQAGCWTPPGAVSPEGLGPHVLLSARFGTDERALVVTFVGGSEELFDYEAKVIETPTAVSVAPLSRPTAALPPGGAVTAVGHVRRLVVSLRQPIGGRVLVNLDATAVAVAVGSL